MFQAHLPVITHTEVQEWLARQLKGYGLEDTWISARGTKGDWHWITGKPRSHRLALQSQLNSQERHLVWIPMEIIVNPLYISIVFE